MYPLDRQQIQAPLPHTMAPLDVSKLLNMPLIPLHEHQVGNDPFRGAPLGAAHSVMKKPKRNLTAYNLFFRDERRRLLDALPVREEGKPKHSHGKISFQDLARVVSAKWKGIDPSQRSFYAGLAAQDKIRHRVEMDKYKHQQEVQQKQQQEQQQDIQGSATAGQIHTDFELKHLALDFDERYHILDLPTSLRSIFDEDKCIGHTSAAAACPSDSARSGFAIPCTPSTRGSSIPSVSDAGSVTSTSTSTSTSSSSRSSTRASANFTYIRPGQRLEMVDKKLSMESVFGEAPLTLLGDIPDNAPWPF